MELDIDIRNGANDEMKEIQHEEDESLKVLVSICSDGPYLSSRYLLYCILFFRKQMNKDIIVMNVFVHLMGVCIAFNWWLISYSYFMYDNLLSSAKGNASSLRELALPDDKEIITHKIWVRYQSSIKGNTSSHQINTDIHHNYIFVHLFF